MATFLTTARLNASLDTALTGVNHVSLHTGDPGVAGLLLELTTLTAAGYARQTVSFDAAASSSKGSHAEVDFLADGGNWPEVTHVGFWNSSTFMGSWPLDTARQIDDGETLAADAGAITLAAAGAA
jgi:hypothetical protein